MGVAASSMATPKSRPCWSGCAKFARKINQRRDKKCGPGQTRRLTGTALGRVIVTGGLIKRRRNLTMLCYAAMTAGLIHRAIPGAPIVTANQEFVMPGHDEALNAP
jgi:hypothetical protein